MKNLRLISKGIFGNLLPAWAQEDDDVINDSNAREELMEMLLAIAEGKTFDEYFDEWWNRKEPRYPEPQDFLRAMGITPPPSAGERQSS